MSLETSVGLAPLGRAAGGERAVLLPAAAEQHSCTKLRKPLVFGARIFLLGGLPATFFILFSVFIAYSTDFSYSWAPNDVHPLAWPSYEYWVPTLFHNNAEQITVFSMVFACCLIPWLLHALIHISGEPEASVLRQLSEARSSMVNGSRDLLGLAWASVKEGCYIELARQPSVLELAEGATPALIEQRNAERLRMPIGPNCELTEDCIRMQYPSDEVLATQVVLLMKLALGLLAYGHCTIDVETLIIRAAAQLEMPQALVSIGHRQMIVRFGAGPTHILSCDRDFVFSALADLTSLVTALAIGEIDDAPTALYVADLLLERPLPYGWLVFQVDFWLIAPWAAIGAYYGSYWDMLGALCISPSVLLTMKICRVFQITHLEIVLVPFALGVCTPLVWRFVSNGGQDICHVLPQLIAPMLIHLPGAQLVWGALEMIQGSLVHGSARLVYGMVQAMLLAIFVVVGWQFWGQGFGANAYMDTMDSEEEGQECRMNATFRELYCESVPQVSGVLANMPDSQWCPEPFFAGRDPKAPEVIAHLEGPRASASRSSRCRVPGSLTQAARRLPLRFAVPHLVLCYRHLQHATQHPVFDQRAHPAARLLGPLPRGPGWAARTGLPAIPVHRGHMRAALTDPEHHRSFRVYVRGHGCRVLVRVALSHLSDTSPVHLRTWLGRHLLGACAHPHRGGGQGWVRQQLDVVGGDHAASDHIHCGHLPRAGDLEASDHAQAQGRPRQAHDYKTGGWPGR